MGMKLRSLFTSFVDGVVGEGLFGDLRIPDFPTQIFSTEPDLLTYKLRLTGYGRKEDMERLKREIYEALDAARAGRRVEIEDTREAPAGAHHVAG